jgi:hypothetical protein
VGVGVRPKAHALHDSKQAIGNKRRSQTIGAIA